MQLNYQPTFEARGWLKNFRVNRSVRSEWVECTTELPADFWAPSLGKKIQVAPIGQERVQHVTELPTDSWAPAFITNIWGEPIGKEGVEYATELPAEFWAPGLVKKIQSEWISQELVGETYYWTNCWPLSPEP